MPRQQPWKFAGLTYIRIEPYAKRMKINIWFYYGLSAGVEMPT